MELKRRKLGKGINAVIEANKLSSEKIEKPGFIEVPYPKEPIGMPDVIACLGFAFGFIALGMAIR
jgi:hypothetical protein